jgi:hypothetical protein
VSYSFICTCTQDGYDINDSFLSVDSYVVFTVSGEMPKELFFTDIE